MLSNLNEILNLFDKTYLDHFARLFEGNRVTIHGLQGSSKAIFIASLLRKVDGGIIVITRSNRDGGDLASDLSLFLKEGEIFFFPSRETLPYDDSEPFKEIVSKRIVALSALLMSVKGVFILPVKTFTDFFIPKKIFQQSIVNIVKNSLIPPMELSESLSQIGYVREERVTYQGCFSLRGDILDVFLNGTEFPVRIEFYDDVVESVREFSPVTQRTLREIDEISVLPFREVIVNQEVSDNLGNRINEGNREVIEKVQELGYFQGIENYVSLIYDHPGTVVDYFDSRVTFLFDSLQECRRQADFFKLETNRIYHERKDRIFLLPPGGMMADFDELLKGIGNYMDISLSPQSQEGSIDFEISEKKGYRGQLQSFKKDVEEILQDGYTVIVGAGYEGQTNRLRELLKDLLDLHDRLLVMTMDIHEGFISKSMKLAVFLDREIFNRKKRYIKKFLEVRSKPIDGVFDVRPGDYIVHIEHGIGIFRGIERLKTGEAEKDFIKIEYRDGDEIFIPVDQINLLQKYIGQDGRIPRIDKLGSDTWKKIKAHVKKSVKNLAKELLEIYSVRVTLKGYSFSRDFEWQHEFESGFRYEETIDQLRTIEEIKRDMESSMPMDRLICGDVGFGKTEVAIRAAFKAVMDGKQVAVLVPTTVLAEQHLNTFQDRFSLYPINVEMLSRFKTPREQRTIIRNLKNGLIDVVIGTHRLIQKDVQFRDLGLVIIDEEQRFGVEHKEKLKQLRKLVDVMTMSATPIPRTLYMSMTKIRDMSTMETPPRDRVPIETFVMEYDEDVIRKAIMREVERGGQVYYVHNRVKTIEEKLEALRRLLPSVTFEIAHGQMNEHELEEVMKAFYDMEFQVLVTTTIIESGLDIPNVNTIIIERADRFGLAQLYQLRGRVGRSKRKAYAYLLYPRGMVITEKAEKRLSVINDHTELGAGFSIAMKDLEIRGAGNILGREQHGDMLAVGFEMYVKLLDEAIREIKQDTTEVIEVEPVLDVPYRGYIPESYIESEILRIEVYKRLAEVRKKVELDALKDELMDRFGTVPQKLHELIDVVLLKILCRDVGIRIFRERENELELTFERSRVDILNLIQKVNQNRRIFSISPRDYNTLHIYKNFSDNREKFEFLKDLFDYDENS